MPISTLNPPLENKTDKYEIYKKQLCSYNIIGAFGAKEVLCQTGQKLMENKPSRKNWIS